MTQPRQRLAQATALFVALLFLAVGIPLTGFAASADVPEPAWTIEGTRWDRSAGTVTPDMADAFAALWTARFLDSAGLEAYLNRPGLYDDGYNHLTEDEKAFLVVHLIRHWQAKFGSFGQDYWTGEAADDQKKFEELASMVYVTVFAKDEFLASLRASLPTTPEAPPVGEADAGLAEFPGMSQEEITAYFEALHAENVVIRDAPAPEALDATQHLAGSIVTDIAAPERALPELIDTAVQMTRDIDFPALAPESVTIPTPESLRRERGSGADPVDPTQPPAVPDLLGDILGLVPPTNLDPGPAAEGLLNILDAGTYLACGRLVGHDVTCAPTPVPLGTIVSLNLDGDVLTGIAGQEVAVHLTPTVHPDYALTGFAASLSVQRTEPSTLPTSQPLPAEVWVVYRAAPAGVQILAGFSGVENTLGDSQEIRVTLKDVALALAGDVKILAELTREGPGQTMTLLAGFSKVDATAFPVIASDPTSVGLHFAPVPASLAADLRFADLGTQDLLEGHVTSSALTTVTASIEMDQGPSHREMLGIIEDLPTEIDFKVVSEAVGAVDVLYDANAPFPRFEFHDVLIPDVAQPSVYTTLDAVVTDIPASIGFQLARPFDVTYTASGRVGEAAVAIQRFDGDGLLQAFAGHVEGIPSQWSIAGSDAPFSMEYQANGPIDVLDGAMYDRAEALVLSAHAEAIPAELSLLVEEGHVHAETGAPVGLVEAFASKGGMPVTVVPGEFASYASDGAGALAAAARVAGFTSFDLDTRVQDLVHANVKIAGGEPFTAIVDDPSAYAVAQISNLPTEIDLALTPASFTYDLAEPIAQIDVHGEVGDLVANVQVKDLPDQLTVSWTETSLVYDANAAITSIAANLQQGDLLAWAQILGIPEDFTVAWPDGTASFTTPGAIGQVNVAASILGAPVYSFPGDHVVVVKNGDAIGASLQLSGIQSLSADPRNGGAYSLGLSPGGQEFRVFADVDGLLAQAYVSNLPQTLGVDLNPSLSSFGYDANQPIARVWAYAELADGSVAFVDMDSLPSRVDVSWTLGSAPVVTYDASGSLGAISAYLADSAGAIYQAGITSLPPYVRLSVAPNAFEVDTRLSADSAAGTGTIGTIFARYGSDGLTIGGSGNHANFYQSGAITRASFAYSGLQYAKVSQAGDNLLVDVKNSAPRFFTAYADTPEAFASLAIDSIPAHVRVTGAGSTFTYDAFGQTIGSISAYFWDRETLTVNAVVRNIPGHASVNVNMPAKFIAYSATSAIGGIDVDAWYGAWYARLRVNSIPASWVASFGNGAFLFDAGASAIGSVEAAVTNHGSYGTLPGNHLNLKYVQAGDVIDASFRMTQVTKASYVKSGTSSLVDLRMGGNTNFAARADLAFTNGDEAYMYASFTPLPGSIQASFGEGVTITTNKNFDLYAYAEYGRAAALAATPTPPFVHGVAVRDGASGTSRAIKAQLYLTGLPTSVSFNGATNSFSFANWRPTLSYLVADAELDNLVSTPINGYVYLTGIPSPQSLSFGMTAESLSGGVKRTKVDLTQSAPMGTLYADLVYGNNAGVLTVSNIPDDIHSSFTLANGQSTFAWDATAAINNVFAGFRVPSQSASFQGYVSLAQLPSDFSLTFGRASGGQGPTLSYAASASTLDVSSFVDASLFGGDLKARLSFGITNLGANVNVFASGTGVRFTSSPATGSVFANVWGSYNYYKADSGVWDAGGFLEYPWAYHLGVNPVVNNLAVTLTGFSDFSLGWGVTSKISGSYSGFSFGWSSMNVALDVYGKVQIRVDWPWPFGSSTITLVDYHTHQTIPVNVLFHKYTNHQSTWFSVSGWAICDWTLSTTIRPHPHGASWNGVSTSASTAEGGAWYVVPNPFGVVPSWAVDLAARYTSPDGGSGPGLGFSYDCW